jgi:tRNA (guanine37-N1)-methyltransferase
LGDFVLNGGEIAALAIIEATARLLPGVLGNQSSLDEESHAAGVLEYPQYTRPRNFRDLEVPAVLLSGDHAAIARYRRQQALVRTRERRPDLFERLKLTAADRALLAAYDAERAG